MEWYHETDVKWLEARKGIITATELISLRPKLARMTKKQRDGKEIHPAFAAMWGSKHSKEAPDPVSRGAMARGHCLEPYAVEEFNHQAGYDLKHWDDLLITCDDMGFSPDALDIEQPPCVNSMSVKDMETQPTQMGEVKCYSIDKHYQNYVTEPSKLPERYQVAAAMLVCPSIEEGHLIFYNPQAEHGIWWVTYKPKDLTEEMCELAQTLAIYVMSRHALDMDKGIATEHTEQEIWDETQDLEDLLMFKG